MDLGIRTVCNCHGIPLHVLPFSALTRYVVPISSPFHRNAICASVSVSNHQGLQGYPSLPRPVERGHHAPVLTLMARAIVHSIVVLHISLRSMRNFQMIRGQREVIQKRACRKCKTALLIQLTKSLERQQVRLQICSISPS